MLQQFLMWCAGRVSLRHRLYREARRSYDRYAARISLQLLGPTAEQWNDAIHDTELVRAEQLYVKVLQLCEEAQDHYNRAVVYYQLGLLQRLWGEYETAAEYFRKALAIFEEQLRERHMARDAISCCYYYLGQAFLERGDAESARPRLEAAVELDRAMGDTRRRAACEALLERCNTGPWQPEGTADNDARALGVQGEELS